MGTDDELAPVIPIRSGEDELGLLEEAVLDALDEQDQQVAGEGPVGEAPVAWLARHPSPRRP